MVKVTHFCSTAYSGRRSMAENQPGNSVYVTTHSEKSELPGEVFSAELTNINKRRNTFSLEAVPVNSTTTPKVKLGLHGLALSGGGIRSSTFNLGVLQALENHALFKRFDYLSTVSGGGYIGSCLSSYYTSFADQSKGSSAKGKTPPPFPFHHQAGEPETDSFKHLRDHSNYLTPARPFAKLRLYGLFLRGLLINTIIVLPLLLFLAVATVLLAKNDIGDALRTKEFSYVVSHEELVKQREQNGLIPGEYQNLLINLDPYINWDAHNQNLDILLSGLPGLKQPPYPGALRIGPDDWLLKNMTQKEKKIRLTLPGKKEYQLCLTAWESNNHFSSLTENWSYWLRKKMPWLFDAWQTPNVNLQIDTPGTNTDGSEEYSLDIGKHLGWKKYVILSGLPKNSYSQQGNFLSDGRWLFTHEYLHDLKVKMYIPDILEDINIRVRSWQSVNNSDWNSANQEKKTAILITHEEKDHIAQKKIEDLFRWSSKIGKGADHTKNSDEQIQSYLICSHLPKTLAITTSHPEAKQLSESKSQWVFINSGITGFVEQLRKLTYPENRFNGSMELTYWHSGEDAEILDPVTHLYSNTFSKTKWVLILYGVILAFYPLLQLVSRVFGLKPWTLRDILTRYVCGAALAIIVIFAFLEVQPLAIFLFYTLKKAFSFSGLFGGIDKAVAILGTLLASAGGMAAANSIQLGAKRSAKFAIYAMGIIGPAVLWLIYLNLCGWILSSENVPRMFENAEGYVIFVFLGLGIFIYVISRKFYNVNRTSNHVFYRDRLSEAFLIKKDGENGKLQHNDTQKLHRLNPSLGPYHLINTTLNITGKSKVNLKGRKAEFFCFGREYSGSRVTGYVKTSRYEGLDQEMGLGTAMAVSAAAAAPNMGRETNPSLTFIMGLLNIRLGYWAVNPLYLQPGFRQNPIRKLFRSIWPEQVGPVYLLREMIGRINEKSCFINLSDGGHIENMGLYELVRRRCKFIVVGDAEADKQMTCHGLGDTIRMVLIDMGIKIRINLDHLYRKKIEKDGTLSFTGNSHYAVGIIEYGENKEEQGYLLYIKSSISKGHAPYIKDYLARHPDFPHQSTADQFFDEAQFEAYRALGCEIGEQVMEELAEMTQERIEADETLTKQWQKDALLHWSDLVKNL